MTFQYVKPLIDEKKLMQEFRDKFQQLRDEIVCVLPDSRGLSLSLTKLQESAFWLNKAITKNDVA